MLALISDDRAALIPGWLSPAGELHVLTRPPLLHTPPPLPGPPLFTQLLDGQRISWLEQLSSAALTPSRLRKLMRVAVALLTPCVVEQRAAGTASPSQHPSDRELRQWRQQQAPPCAVGRLMGALRTFWTPARIDG